MSDPNYDLRLNPKRRRRSQSEINGILRADYESYLEDLSPFDLLGKIPFTRAREAKDALKELILEVDEMGSRDKDFQNSIDWDSIMVEES